MSDRVSQMFWSATARCLRGLKEFIEVYIDNQSIFVIVYFKLRTVVSYRVCHFHPSLIFADKATSLPL